LEKDNAEALRTQRFAEKRNPRAQSGVTVPQGMPRREWRRVDGAARREEDREDGGKKEKDRKFGRGWGRPHP
jgi:hypothetical protein